MPIDDLMGKLITADCELLVRCHFVSDDAFCRSYLDQLLTRNPEGFQTNIAGVKAGTIKYDAAVAGTCIDAIAGASCDTFFDSSSGIDASCQKVFTGTIAIGGACAVDAQCVRGNFCSKTDSAGGCAGTCAAGGTACNDDTHCSGGKVCETQFGGLGARGRCVTPTPAGSANQPCGSNQACKSGLRCAVGTTGPVCQPPAALGEPCEPAGCVTGLVCVIGADDSGLICRAPAAKGEACAGFGHCGGAFLSSLSCDPVTKLCVDAPTTGPCVKPSTFGNSNCNMLTAYCDDSTGVSTCQPVHDLGAACRVNTLECGLTGAVCISSDVNGTIGTCTTGNICAP